ncbi:Fe-S oxidoreductase [Anaerovibrio sp. JC8]|uniref:B12-binding domain-containing radical SAM protein n=1 Tax=Anaerovibrio sp. JC8 TaxID=1240085 RepID=UPI000A0C83E2|nr:B12-binding domain-containing radical SAM protein [Anaerovibrio sp. JC8]ORT99882.1 Fe-S oxidoreductase [Anaerovibrio sp. JC8]
MKKVVWLAFNAKFSHTSLAARYLRQAAAEINIESELLELTINNYIPDILSEIYDHKPDVLGISCYIWNIELVKQVLPLVRKVLPECVIICGGPEVSYEVAEFMTANPAVDFVVRGEGEEAVKELMELVVNQQALDGNRRLTIAPENSGIAWREDTIIHDGQAVTCMDSEAPSVLHLPFAYIDDEMSEIKDKILYYETSRGCPFSCAYCLSCATAGVRFRPLDEVFADLDFFVGHDVRQVKFVDRTFNAKKAHFLPIIQYIKALPDSCRTNFHLEVAVDYLDEETIEVLQSMPKGRVQLEIGVQTTNKDVLKRIARVNHWEDICRNISALQKNGNMHIHTDLIIGLPGEDLASFGRSFNDLYALHTDMLQLGFLKFLKGAAMMKLVAEYDYKYMDIGPYEVLSNNVMDYGQIRWLHIFEQVFELYHNAGRCLKASEYMIQTFFEGNAFEFYSRFTDYWEKLGNHKRAVSAKNLYGYLWAFFRSVAESASGTDRVQQDASYLIMDNLMRYDALTADSGQNRPEFLHWNREKYQEQTAAFWRDQLPSGQGASAVIEGFRFTNWRELNKKYHIEVFDVVVDAPEGTSFLASRPQALLFMYNNRVFNGIIEVDISRKNDR